MRRGKVIIDRERCKGCYLCVRSCPFGVLGPDTKMNSTGTHPSSMVHPEKCTACASCFKVCPDVAITVYELEGDEK